MEWEEKYADAYNESRDEKQKCIIAFVGGTPSQMDRKYFDSTLEACQKIGVKVFIIAFDYEDDHYLRDYYDNVYALFAESTGGRLYYADDFMAVNKIYDDIFIGADISVDSDNDGITDKYEDGLTLFNGSRIKLDKNNPDTDGDGLLDGEEVKIIREYELVDGKMGIRVRGKAFTDPANPDTDGDLEGDATDPTPNDFMLNEILCEKIYELDELAKDYIRESGIPISLIDWNKSHDWLIFMFLRSYNPLYTEENWDIVGGKIDYNFINYVYDKDRAIYEYFGSNGEYYSNNKGEKGDLYHFAATLTGLIYKSGFDDSFFSGLMPEKNIDALCGWAGDLQTAMIDARYILGKEVDYETFKTMMREVIACDESIYEKYPKLLERKYHFPIYDVNADVDAANINELLCDDEFTLNKVLKAYFTNGYKKRFTQFKNNSFDVVDVKQFTENHYLEFVEKAINNDRVYSEEVMCNPLYIVIGSTHYIYNLLKTKGIDTAWPLMDNITFNEEESLAAYDAYTDYLMGQVNEE